MQTNLFSTPGASGAAASALPTDAAKNSDMFTKLLVAQIRNQDPLSPTDPSQFVNQLSQLSQTEALQKLASIGSANASALQSLQVLGLGAQVGAQVMVASGSVQLDAESVAGSVNLTSTSSTTTLVLTGADGQDHKVSLGAQSAGTVPFSIDPGALGLPAGSYSMRVETVPQQAAPGIDIAGRLASVRVGASGSIVLSVAHVGDVGPGDITAFNGKSTPSSL